MSDVKYFIDVMKGKHVKYQKHSNLSILDSEPLTVFERTKNDISPPTNLNEESFYKNLREVKKKTKERTINAKDQLNIDKKFLQQLLNNS